jgi:hypothetical protein
VPAQQRRHTWTAKKEQDAENLVGMKTYAITRVEKKTFAAAGKTYAMRTSLGYREAKKSLGLVLASAKPVR